MRIPGCQLHKYFLKAVFPIAVLHEVGDRVLMYATQEELSTLMAQGMVFGVGSRTKLHNVRMRSESAPLDKMVTHPPTSENSPHRTVSFLDWRAETSFTVQRQHLSCGVVFRHHPKHCEAFAPITITRETDPNGDLSIDGSCL